LEHKDGLQFRFSYGILGLQAAEARFLTRKGRNALEFVYDDALREYMTAKGKRHIVIEVVSSDHSDIEITELYPHIIGEKKAAEFKRRRYAVRETDMGEVLLPPYRLHYADTIRFTLRSFLGIKSIRQEGIEL
jgi:hypothetical protein